MGHPTHVEADPAAATCLSFQISRWIGAHLVNDNNPYSPGTAVGDLRADHTGASATFVRAIAIGLSCCLIGPLYLASYYAYHGIGLGLAGSLWFFWSSYVGPGTLFLAAGLAIGRALSSLLSTVSAGSRNLATLLVALATYSVSIALLSTDYLNWGIFGYGLALPAFSLTCGLATLFTTATYLGLSPLGARTLG